jgi:hypothetical protein
MPGVACPAYVKEIFPEAALLPGGFRLSVRSGTPEAILAACLLHRIPVVKSRIVYERQEPGN